MALCRSFTHTNEEGTKTPGACKQPCARLYHVPFLTQFVSKAFLAFFPSRNPSHSFCLRLLLFLHPSFRLSVTVFPFSFPSSFLLFLSFMVYLSFASPAILSSSGLLLFGVASFSLFLLEWELSGVKLSFQQVLFQPHSERFASKIYVVKNTLLVNGTERYLSVFNLSIHL